MPKSVGLIYTDNVPPAVIELARWLDAVNDRVAKRQNDIAKRWDELRGEDGLVGGTARLLLHGDQPAADADMLAGAIQDVQLALLDPHDRSGVCAALPHMAERARQARGIASLVAAAERYHDQPIPFAGIQSAAIPLLAQANNLLRAHGLEPYANLEAIAAHNRPTLLSRALARLCKRRVRSLLFATVFETRASSTQPQVDKRPTQRGLPKPVRLAKTI